MEKMVGFIKLYFPVFLLGAIFGKVVEMSGIADSIAKTIIELVGEKRTILAIVLMGAILTYSGVSVYVVVFAVYPFAAKLFRHSEYSKTFNPWNDCSWSSHVYDGCATWITTNSKRNTYNFFQNGHLCCTDTWNCRSNFCSYIRFTIFRE